MNIARQIGGALKLQYRKEIDGLRSVAVLPVMFFHANLFGMKGGYVGVDLFFVISGYLITSILMEEIKSGRFSILNFYERRARRILPALSVVLIFSTIVAFILMPPLLLKSYSQSLVSVATFSSNVFFYLTSGYFSTASDEKPLLHTWSLAVEEQYYIFFPILLSALWFLGKKRLTILLALFSIASLLLSQYLSFKQATDANFYLIFSRAWELFVGALVALIGVKRFSVSKNLNRFLGFVGLSLFIFSIFSFDKQTPFPSIYALVPVTGAALIIIYCDSDSILGRILATKLFVSVGLISYSLYLWHQPLFAFLRMKTIGEPAPGMFLGAIVVTFIFSVLSYKFIEKPFRNKKIITKNRICQLSLATIIVFISIGALGYYYKGFESRFEANSYLETAQFSPKRKECHTAGENYLKPDNACRYFGSKVTWAAFGDSHTVEPAYALAKMLEKDGNGLVHLSFSGCPPALLFEAKRPGCSKWIKQALSLLEDDKSIKNILLNFRHSSYLFGDQLDSYPENPNRETSEIFSDSFKGAIDSNEAKEIYWNSFTEIINRLLAVGKNIYLLYPIPELPLNIHKLATPFSVFGGTFGNLKETTTREYYYLRHDFVINKLNELPYGDNLHAIKPFEILCNNGKCPAVVNETALYFDDDHLSVEGSKMLLAGSVIASDLKRKKASIRRSTAPLVPHDTASTSPNFSSK